jgi:hypothetical protein
MKIKNEESAWGSPFLPKTARHRAAKAEMVGVNAGWWFVHARLL